tara:strand:- start:640 stop:3651 length:3012 start_codon:yes stop_codon:yes gene_type:complete
MRKIAILTILIFLGFSQSLYNHPELEWFTFETEHFIIHFHKETENTARETATVAEYIYGPITELYNYEPPEKTHIILKDTDDYANGAAYSFDNKIEIWALPLAFDLRGAHRWLQNVITHEFTHIIQIQASVKYSLNVPGGFFQYIGYENEKRDDVLYGYPDRIMSYPLPGIIIPPWLAEGTAQFMYPGANFDFLDSHRDMIIRDRVLNNNLLTFAEMNSFGKKGIGNESTYNQGFSFITWLAKKYGNDINRRISEEISRPLQLSISSALENVTGIQGDELYKQWAGELSLDYTSKTNHIIQETSGKVIEDKGGVNLYPAWSPNGKKFAFLSNRGHDYFSQTNLYIHDIESGKSKKIASRVESKPTWINNNHILYSRRSKKNENGSTFFDLYKYDLNLKEETQLTISGRFLSPLFLETENKFIAFKTIDGSTNVYISDINHIDLQPITQIDDGTVLFSASYNSDENLLYLDGNDLHGRQLYSLSLDGHELTKITSKKWDSRNPNFENNMLYYSEDKSGIFNIVCESGNNKSYLTNVYGGAFMPDVNQNGDVLFSLYKNGEYEIAITKVSSDLNENQIGYSKDYYLNRPNSILISEKDNTDAEPYKDEMSRLFFLPKMMIDYNTFKPGFYLFSTEFLNRMSFIVGGSLNTLMDKDLFAIFEYKKWKYTMYLNFFGIQRHIIDLESFADNDNDKVYDIGSDYKTLNDIRFTLFAADIGTKFPFKNQLINLQYSYQKYRQNQKLKKTIQETSAGDIITDFPAQYGAGFDYLRNHSFLLKGEFSTQKSQFLGNMLPNNGYKIEYNLKYDYNQFMEGLDFDEGIFKTIFSPEHTFRTEIDAKKYFKLSEKLDISGSLNGKIGLVSNQSIDDFFYYFNGGLTGLKGFTFYDTTLYGPNLFLTSSVIRKPIFTEKSIVIGPLNLQNFSIGLMGQYGGGYKYSMNEIVSGRPINWFSNINFGQSTGLEFRLSGFSFYSYPTAFSYEVHYPVSMDYEDIKPKHYFTILFDFQE